jgi:polyhydroxyalkanoate synthase
LNGTQGQPPLQFDPAKLQELQQRYIADASALWNQGLQDGADTLVASDRRFSNEAWKANPVSKFSASTYLLNARTLMELADAVQADAKTRARVRFAVEQWMAATAPSNFLALNAEAQQKAIESQRRKHCPGHHQPAARPQAGPCVHDRRERVRGRQKRRHHRRRGGV